MRVVCLQNYINNLYLHKEKVYNCKGSEIRRSISTLKYGRKQTGTMLSKICPCQINIYDPTDRERRAGKETDVTST
jgi:hypothetical protein